MTSQGHCSLIQSDKGFSLEGLGKESHVEPEPSKVLVVKWFEAPKTKTQVRAFLGQTGYYQRFIANYSAVALPLTELTKKMAPTDVTWTAECETAFQELKRLLCATPVLASPDFEKPIQTDASEYGVGAVLSQRDTLGWIIPLLISVGSYFLGKFGTPLWRRSV